MKSGGESGASERGGGKPPHSLLFSWLREGGGGGGPDPVWHQEQEQGVRRMEKKVLWPHQEEGKCSALGLIALPIYTVCTRILSSRRAHFDTLDPSV